MALTLGAVSRVARTRGALACSVVSDSRRAYWGFPKLFSTESKEGESADKPAATEAADDPVKALQDKLKDLDDKYRRCLADSENLRQRTRLEVKQAQEFGIQKFAKDLVPIADILEMALEAVPKDQRENAENPHMAALFKGLTGTHALLLKSFEQHGLVRIAPVGEKFNPNYHEAQFELDDPHKEPGTVGVVIRSGYMLHGRTLRAAGVGVVRKR